MGSVVLKASLRCRNTGKDTRWTTIAARDSSGIAGADRVRLDDIRLRVAGHRVVNYAGLLWSFSSPHDREHHKVVFFADKRKHVLQRRKNERTNERTSHGQTDRSINPPTLKQTGGCSGAGAARSAASGSGSSTRRSRSFALLCFARPRELDLEAWGTRLFVGRADARSGLGNVCFREAVGKLGKASAPGKAASASTTSFAALELAWRRPQKRSAASAVMAGRRGGRGEPSARAAARPSRHREVAGPGARGGPAAADVSSASPRVHAAKRQPARARLGPRC